MDKKTARKTLVEMDFPKLSKERLAVLARYLNANEGEAGLDGEFTEDEMEAIVMWMHDPHGVADA